MWLNDPRVFVVDGVYHLYYQQPPREIGRAVSKDLISWRWQPGGITRGPDGAWDDKDICTSDFFHWDGKVWSLYTGRSNANGEDGHVQRIGLAISTDEGRFERHADNPVLLPDPRWYETDHHKSPGYGNVAWRDPAIWRNPSDGLFYAYITGRVNRGPGPKRGCIALARSRDMIHWECLPPCYAPGLERYHEVPQLLPWRDDLYVLFFGCKRGGFTEMRYVYGPNPLRFDDADPGRPFLGSPVRSSGRGMEYSSWVVPRSGGHDVVHLVYEWRNGKLERGRISLPKRLKGTPETGLALILREDLQPGEHDALDLTALPPTRGWQARARQLIATPSGQSISLPLLGRGARTLSMDVNVGRDAIAGIALDDRPGRDPALRVLLDANGCVTTRIHGIKTHQNWPVGTRRGNLSLTVVGRHVGIYFNRRYLGVACAAERPGDDAVSLICSGESTCVFAGLAEREIRMAHAHAPQ